MPKVTEEVIASIKVRISYDKKSGAREHALGQIEMGCNRFGWRADVGGFEVKSLPETLTVK